MIEQLRLRINAEEIAAICYSPDSSTPVLSGICLHGAGSSSKERGDTLCSELAKRGMRIIAFDFSGWGGSTQHTPSSIQKRVVEAREVMERLLLPYRLPLAILAFSMSGQVAIELLRTYGKSVQCVALFNPAIYDSQALATPFGAEFSAIIRRPGSWRKAGISSAFEGYQGKTLLVKSEWDDVIPPGVFDLIAQSARANSLTEVVVDAAPHQLGSFMNAHPAIAAHVADVIAGLLASQAHANT